MTEIGYISLVFALAFNAYSLVGFIFGIRTKNRNIIASAKGGTLAVAISSTIASLIMIYLLVTSDFSVKYVTDYTSRELPTIYKFAAFWAGNGGSMLLWIWVLSIYTALVTFLGRKNYPELAPYVSAVMTAINTFFILLTIAVEPFAKLPSPPADGHGLNPMLQNPAMFLHPVTTYLGYVGFIVPYAFAMTALILRRADDLWIRVTRRWTVIGFLFLTLGNFYGAQWAYVELGWGGMWAWDPVENASFLPWLTGAAFLHSVMIQERKNMLKVWNMVLIIVTFLLVLFGSLLVRTGIVASVHAFGNGPLGSYLLTFMAIVAVVSFYLLFDRMSVLTEDNAEFRSYISKESSFLFNNLLLLGAAFAITWGTLFPVITEAVRGVQVSVSAPFYNQVNIPIFLAMLFLMGICPLIAWQKSSLKNLRDNFLYPLITAIIFAIGGYLYGLKHGLALLAYSISVFVVTTILREFYKGVKVRRKMTGEGVFRAFWRLINRNRRRYGGYIIHLGLIFMALAITGQAFEIERNVTVAVGETFQIGRYSLQYQGLAEKNEKYRDLVYANVLVSRGGQQIATMQPAKSYAPRQDQPITEVDIRGTLREDLYVILAGWENGGSSATFRVLVKPLMIWMWIGGYMTLIGAAFALWPGKYNRFVPKFTRRSGEYVQA